MSELFFSHPVSDPVTANREMIQNALMSRKGFFDRFFDRRRDLNSECGYPETNSAAASVEGYKELYDRMPIARRVVEILPKECWQVQPTVYETEDPEDETEFEKAWDNLSKTLRGEQSWYQDESGSPVWDYLKRADILSGIGHFGIVLLGIDDGKMLDQPVDGVVATMQMSDGTVRNKFPSSPVVNSKLPDAVKSEEEALLNTYVKNFGSTDGQYDYSPYGMKANPVAEGIQGTDAQYVGVQLSPSEAPSKDGKGRQKRNLVFMRCFDESMVQIVQYEADLRNPRFGKPVMYRVTLNDPREQHGGVGLSTATVRVHWSRVIHIADNLQSSEIFGSPRMRPVLNDLLDLRKIYGASAEGYWKSCFSILQFSTHPQMGGDVDVNVEKIKDAVDNVNNSLQRDLLGLGGAWSTIAPSVVDPTPHIQVRLTAIALSIGCPMRVFMGTEQGVLAGDQDGEAFYLRRVPERQQRTITPRQIIPLVDRLIQMGVLPEPKKTKEDLPTDGGEAVENLGAGTYRRFRKVQVEVYNADTEQIEIQDREIGSTVIKTTGGYSIEWPDMDSMTAKDKAAVLLQRTQAYSAYVSGGLEAMIPPHEFMTEFDSVPDARARQIIDAAAEAHEAQDTMTTAPMMGGRPVAPEEGQEGWEPPEPPPEFTENAEDPVDTYIENAFCPTGKGGGVDPTCSPGKTHGPSHAGQSITHEPKTAPPPGAYVPDVDQVGPKGITHAARIGVPGMATPPPPAIGRMPNLTSHERHAETQFINHFMSDPDKVAGDFLKLVKDTAKPGEALVFGTDDAKALSPDWVHPDQSKRAQNRATLNTPLHQTANAIAKRAFLQHLDTLPAGSNILVTVGGCGAGKGYALKNVPQALEQKNKANVVWDSAGDQNATENPWILEHAQKRGLNVTYIHVHADPEEQWAHPMKGVVSRAADPRDGRMVDAKVFADSYAIGNRNHQAFYEAHKNDATFLFLDNTGTPKLVDGIKPEALKYNRTLLAKKSQSTVAQNQTTPDHVKRGALMGARIWMDD